MRIFIEKVLNFMEKPQFALLLVGIELLCYFLNLDLVIILTISVLLTFTFLFGKNYNCLLVLFLFMCSMISYKNSPANANPNPEYNYFFQKPVYITCIIAAAIPSLVVCFKFAINVIRKKVDIDLCFVSILILGISFLLNGILCNNYNFLNLLYGSFLFFFFLVLLYSILPNINLNDNSIKSISKQVAIYALVPIIELGFFYIKAIISGEEIVPRFRNIYIGWGNRNTIGFLLLIVICFLPSLFKSGMDKKWKFFGIFIFSLAILSIAMTFSRQSYLCLFILFSICCIYSFLKSKSKAKIKIVIFCSFLAAFAVAGFLVLYLNDYFSEIDINDLSGRRIELYELAIDAFKNNVFLGSGFYFNGGDPEVRLSSVLPYCCHNTILELLGACGIAGLFSYLFYRVSSSIKIFENYNESKNSPILGCLVVILLSLLDIHIFDLFGTGVYTVLFAMALSNKKNIEVCSLQANYN